MKELELTYNAVEAGCPFGTTANGLCTTGNAIISASLDGVVVPIIWDAQKRGFCTGCWC